MKDREFVFELTGVSPLLMHWDNIEWADQIAEVRTETKERDKKSFSAGDDRCPAETWKGCVYNDGTHVCVPQENLRTALMKAGAKLTYSKQTTFKKIMPSAVLFPDPYLAFAIGGKQIKFADIEAIKGTFPEQRKAAEKLGFTLDVRRASIGSSKHVRVRPKFTKWTLSGNLLVVDDIVSDDKLLDVMTVAGNRIGIGDWRPDSPKSPGPFGRFTVALRRA